jgi:hypothetical protein
MKGNGEKKMKIIAAQMECNGLAVLTDYATNQS